jgi:hypothetical protein
LWELFQSVLLLVTFSFAKNAENISGFKVRFWMAVVDFALK